MNESISYSQERAEMDGIIKNPGSAPRLPESNAEKVSYTPMLDIKPYIPRFDLIEAPECGAEGLFVTRRLARIKVIHVSNSFGKS